MANNNSGEVDAGGSMANNNSGEVDGRGRRTGEVDGRGRRTGEVDAGEVDDGGERRARSGQRGAISAAVSTFTA